MELTVYAYEKTESGYSLSCGQSCLCRLSGSASNVRITGEGFCYTSEFDMDSTLCPGITKRIIREEKGSQAVLRWEGRDRYTLFLEGVTYRIASDGMAYLLTAEDGNCLLSLPMEDPELKNPDYLQKPRHICSIDRATRLIAAVSTPLAAIFAAFPLLQFGF